MSINIYSQADQNVRLAFIKFLEELREQGRYSDMIEEYFLRPLNLSYLVSWAPEDVVNTIIEKFGE